MTSDQPATKTEQTERPRTPYAKPKLVHYGNIREITKAVGNKGNADGGSGMTQKTQP